MKDLVKKLFNSYGFEVMRINSNHFVIAGIHYDVDPCSVGRTPQGELTARAATRMIRDNRMEGLRIADIGCGVGIIGLTLLALTKNEPLVQEMVFVDINVFNLNSLRRTITAEANSWISDKVIRYYLSDGLKNIPSSESFDVIISNPPHIFAQSDSPELNSLSPGALGTYDSDWSFHKNFYFQCHEYLTDEGEIWFLENGDVAAETDFLPFIATNNRLEYLGISDEPLIPNFFWMKTRKK